MALDRQLSFSQTLKYFLSHEPGQLIDMVRYPFFSPTGLKAVEFKNACREQIKRTGICLLPGFLSKKAVQLMTKESTELLELAYHNHVVGNAYLMPNDPSLGIDHVFNQQEHSSLGVIAYDQIAKHHALRELYEWEPFMDFIAEFMLFGNKLYRYADPLGALNISVMGHDDYLRWHFDQTDFVVSLCLQDALAGGDFEYVPFIRSKKQENYQAVGRVLSGERDQVKRVPMEAGSLVFFEGRHALHRVTPIKGALPRLVALLGFDTKPGVKSTEHLQHLRYGRCL